MIFKKSRRVNTRLGKNNFRSILSEKKSKNKRNRKLRGSRSVPEIEPISTENVNVELVIYNNN